jgi:DNA polymerase (family 10)
MAKQLPETVEEHNKPLSRIFHEMASCYRYLGSDERFRAIAYDNAARTIDGLREDISRYADSIEHLDELKGIGESIAEKITEYLRTGKIKTYEQLKKKVPADLVEFMDVNGMGPSTIRTLHEKLGIDSKDALILAIEKGRLSTLKGFGEKKIENISRALKLFKESGRRHLLPEAITACTTLLGLIRNIKGVERAEAAGSLRRGKETVGDLDIIIRARPISRKSIVSIFTKLPGVARIIAAGETKASVFMKEPGIQVDIRLVSAHEYGAAMLYFTGSKEHNIHLRIMAKEKGWKINEYGLFDAGSGKRLAGNSEEEMYRKLGMPFIPPELREDRGEIEWSMKKTLPKLVEEKDIRGDLQMHSTWSDGAETIETIARHVMRQFPHYEYIAITDHSPSERIAGGLSEKEFTKQFLEIEKVNKILGRDFVKKGVEVDILPDGSLDLTDTLLAQFDWVTASIHSGFSKDNTERLLKACAHPSVHCIGHPSGRLIGKREGYTVDWKKLFAEAAKTNTAIEINAQPERLDLGDELVREAVSKGVKITISTDAHNLNQFGNMGLGVTVARRGWCEKKNILNTMGWTELKKALRK